jgi:sugar lactone lactonase YvrE
MLGDRDNFRTQIFDLDGKLIEIWTDPGAPWGFELLEDGSLLMADGYAERVVHVSPEGKPLGAFGTMGKIPGRFHFAHSIAIDKQGAIYVAEIQNWRVQKFIPVR